ncbi:MAG: hypothetical protein CMN05_12810 [Roseibacillus sp.]|nr:hypothetical protein [Roseibacillus sp.]MBP36669.1 hypothetical protein [Roseibacillus sp.]
MVAEGGGIIRPKGDGSGRDTLYWGIGRGAIDVLFFSACEGLFSAHRESGFVRKAILEAAFPGLRGNQAEGVS